MLRLNNINVRYKDRIIFDNTNINITEGRLTAIIGESGSGKTTLLYILGLISSFSDYKYVLNENEIDIHDHNIKAKLRKNQIGFVFQDKNLHDYLSIENNLKLYCYISGIEYNQDKAIQILNKVHLDLSLDTLCGNLSGGEKQRLAIACALIKDPVLLIADEPTSALDRKNTDIILSVLKEISLEGKMVVIASHSPYVINQCDIVYRIENHKIECNEHVILADNKKDINNRIIDSSFYRWYMKFQFGKGKIEKFLSFALPIVIIGIILSAYSLKDGMVQSYEHMLNKFASNEVFVESKYEIDSEKYYRIKGIEGVEECYYSYEIPLTSIITDNEIINTNEVFYIVSYYDYQKEYFNLDKEYNGDIYLSYNMSMLINQASSYTIESDILNESEYQLGGIFKKDYQLTQSQEKYIVYIPYKYFNQYDSAKMLLHLQDFNVFNNIEEDLHRIDANLKLSMSQDKYLVQMKQLNSYTSLLNTFTMILLILSVIILAVGQIYVIHGQKYELAILKANGLMNIEIVRMMFYQCIKDIIQMIAVVYVLLFVVKMIMSYIGIGFVLYSIYHIIILMLFIILDYIIPTFISCMYICHFDPEKIIRF